MGFLGRITSLFRRRGSLVTGSLARNFSYANGTLATNETIFSAVTMLAGAVASAPIAVRQDYRKLAPRENGIARLCEYGFNPQMTTFQFIRSLETLRDVTGAGYAIKELDPAGNIAALWLMRTELVEPAVERESRELYYHIRDPDGGEGYYVHSAMILAVTHISEDGVHPVNPVAVLASSLKYDREVKEFSIEQMQNGLRASLVITVRGNQSQDQLEKYDEMLRKFKRSGVLYLDDGKTVTELKNQNIIDPKVFEVENITVARVARAYTIPLEKFLPDKTSYSSAEQSDLNYLKDTILPIARMYEQEFSRKLLTERERDDGLSVKFSLNGFARADMKTRGDFYMKGVRSGWFCLDDVRELEDMPPLPDGLGREFFISKDLIPVRSLRNLLGGQTEVEGSEEG